MISGSFVARMRVAVQLAVGADGRCIHGDSDVLEDSYVHLSQV